MHSRYLLVLVLCLIGYSGWAQPGDRSRHADSLKGELLKNIDDTMRISILTGLAMAGGDPKSGLKYGQQAAELAEKIKWSPGMAMAYNVQGASYKSLSDYPSALENYLKSLKINEALNNQVNIARNTANIGNVYRELGNFTMALEYFNRSLKINESLNRKFGITNNLSDMAIIYSEMKNNKGALEYFNRALSISSEINDSVGLAIIFANIGNVYGKMERHDTAIAFFIRSLAINEALGRKIGIAISYINIGDEYKKVATDTTGRHWSNRLFAADKNSNLDKAAFYYNKSLAIFSELSALDNVAEVYKYLSQVYLERKDYKSAFEVYRKYKELTDTIFSNDNRVKLANLTAKRAEMEKQQQVGLNALTQRKRRNETILFVVIIALLSGFTMFVIRERRKSERLLLNILPEKVANELKENGVAAANHFDNVTVLFTDFVGFTSAAEQMNPQALVNELHTCFKAFDEIISHYGIEKIKTIGDAYMAVAGLPDPDPQHAVKTIKAAREIVAFIAERRQLPGNSAFEIRVGAHSGSVVAGIVGVKKFAYDIWGDTVNTAARMEEASEAGKINISAATYELVKERFSCVYRGEVEAKNKGGMAMYFVADEISRANRG